MNGEGSIYPRRDKLGKVIGYQAALSIGHNQKGQPKRRFVSGKSKEEVRAKLDKLKADRHHGLLTATDQVTVGELCDRWLDHKEQSGENKPNTIRSYRDTVRLYIKHTLGGKKLEALTALHVQGMLSQLMEEGHTAPTRRYSLSVLKMALNYALGLGLVARNVASGIKPPKKQTKEMRVLTVAEAVRFREAARSHRLYIAFLLALMTGMRRGEVLGLQWEDINFNEGYLTVKHNLTDCRGRVELTTPKTDKSKRRIYLAPDLLNALREHQQAQQLAAAKAGEAWQGQGYVCASELGGHTDPRNFERMFRSVLERSGVTKVRLHDLRHTTASLLLLKGHSAKVVSELLGHTTVGFTLDRYAHVYDEQRRGAVLDFEDLTSWPANDPTAAPLLQASKETFLN